MEKSVRFEKCTGSDCAKLPVHGYVVAKNDDGRVATTNPIFSVEAGRIVLQRGVELGHITGDQAGQLEHAMVEGGLAKDITPEDKLFRHLDVDAAMIMSHMRHGIIPREDGSGPTRIELCTGICGHPNCGKYPAHAAIYLDGFAKPISPLLFSREQALLFVGTGMDSGIFTVEQAETLTKTATALPIEEKVGRADRMAAAGSEHLPEILSYVFGVTPVPADVKPAEFRICPKVADLPKGHPGRHGHFYVYGYSQGNVLSSSKGEDELERLVESGFITSEDAFRVARELRDAELPEMSVLDDENLAGIAIISTLLSR